MKPKPYRIILVVVFISALVLVLAQYWTIKSKGLEVSHHLSHATLTSMSFANTDVRKVCSTLFEQIRTTDPYFGQCEFVYDVSHASTPTHITLTLPAGPADRVLAELTRSADLATHIHERRIFVSLRSRDYRSGLESWLDLIFRHERMIL